MDIGILWLRTIKNKSMKNNGVFFYFRLSIDVILSAIFITAEIIVGKKINTKFSFVYFRMRSKQGYQNCCDSRRNSNDGNMILLALVPF